MAVCIYMLPGKKRMMADETDKQVFLRTLAKRFIYQAQGGNCHICGLKLRAKFNSPLLTIDHVWPMSKAIGGNKFMGNVLLSHLKCNREKADRLPTLAEVEALNSANRRMGLSVAETWHWDGAEARGKLGGGV